MKFAAATALPATVLAACGGSGDGGTAIEGGRDTDSISSGITGTSYLLSVYVPPASAGPRDGMPVVYVLDGESWFETLVGIVESTRTRLIIVALHTSGQRSRDFVPANACTANGGGHSAYLDFIRRELIPHVERTIGGDPGQRVLFGHSHGGSFVLYAMFSEPPDQHTFRSYLASDSSISCMPAVADEWERSYAAAHRDLPVRLNLSYASNGNNSANLIYAAAVAQRDYGRFTFRAQAYSGTHSGIVPQVLADGLAFALADRP
ncbi:MAG: alpha/beta hydrolase [Rubrivivax sp.]|nr:alpha/beta hydrolase [Rubrivivax sp.]